MQIAKKKSKVNRTEKNRRSRDVCGEGQEDLQPILSFCCEDYCHPSANWSIWLRLIPVAKLGNVRRGATTTFLCRIVPSSRRFMRHLEPLRSYWTISRRGEAWQAGMALLDEVGCCHRRIDWWHRFYVHSMPTVLKFMCEVAVSKQVKPNNKLSNDN